MSDSLVQRLQRYGTYHRLQQVALSRIASVMHGYNSKQLEELQAALGTEQAAQGQHREQMGPCGASDQDVPCMKKIPYPRVVEVLRSGRFDLSEAEITQVREERGGGEHVMPLYPRGRQGSLVAHCCRPWGQLCV
jgi:hypothetical protein